MMFAVIKTGGKQYRVSAGDEFTVEKLVAEAGETIQFTEGLMLGGDAMKYLNRAVSKDHRILFRIASDPECRKHPQIIQRLKDFSVDDIVTVRNESDANDRDDAVSARSEDH